MKNDCAIGCDVPLLIGEVGYSILEELSLGPMDYIDLQSTFQYPSICLEKRIEILENLGYISHIKDEFLITQKGLEILVLYWNLEH